MTPQEKANEKVKFGLQPQHIKAIWDEIERCGKREIDKDTNKLKKFRISYEYLASGMEGKADVFPEKIIEADTKDKAAFIYRLMFFASSKLDELEYLEKIGGYDFSSITYKSFLQKEEWDKYWGLSIEEIK